MAHRAVVPVNTRASDEVGFVRGNGNGFGHLFRDSRMQRATRQSLLERHCRRSGRDRRGPGGEIDVHTERNQDQTDDEPDYESFQRMLLELKLAVYTFGAIPDCRDAAGYVSRLCGDADGKRNAARAGGVG